MHLSKLWNKYKVPLISSSATTGSLIIGIWNFDFQKLFPSTTLSTQIIYDLRVGLTLLFLLILSFLLSCVFIYCLAITIKEERTFKKELKDTIRSIRETVENKYIIHQKDFLSLNISKASEEETNREFDLPTGILAGQLFDIHLKEISIFSSIVRKVSLSFTLNSEVSLSSPELIQLFSELLIAHNVEIKKYHNGLVTDLFSCNNSFNAETMTEYFNKQADIETKLRCRELFSALKIKNSSPCSDMVFPPWEPIKKKEPEKHHFVEENSI